MYKVSQIMARQSLAFSEVDRATERSGVLLTLCVHDNPMFLHQVCRHLEQRGDISVEIALSVEDALHLMRYVPFDVIITDCSLCQTKNIDFLIAVREQGITVPFIYFTRTRITDFEAGARPYGPVYFVEWEESLLRGFMELYLLIKRTAEENLKEHDTLAEYRL